MKSSILLTVYTLLARPSTAWKAFCPVRSPSNQFVYVTDKPSWSTTSLLKTQCTMECSFCSNKKTCGDCRAFNYNSTSQNCSVFYFEPKTYAIDPKASTVGYRDNQLPATGFWSTVLAKLCATIFDGNSYKKCSHVFMADQYCGVDHHYCKLPNGTEAFCTPDNSTVDTTECSLPFTYSGTLYLGCAPGVGCLTVNRTTNASCSPANSVGVIDVISIIGGQSVPVKSIFGWIIWMTRQVATTYNWNLPWSSHKNGFGSAGDSNFWLGLEKVYQLTSSSNYRLRIEMKAQSTALWYSVEYWSFKVGNEASTKYQLNVDGFSGDTGNGMQFVSQYAGCGAVSGGFPNGMKFSTFDSDNYRWIVGSCAVERGGGWWFNWCSYAELMGGDSVFTWIDMSASCNQYILTEARMMMKL